ncbi:MAG: glycosyltransferase family 4 protein [Candidatus Omnitrophota bacterium]
MRILLLTTHLNIGGISSYTVSLAKMLKANGKEVYVASSGGVLVSELTQGGVSHIKIDILTKSELSLKVFKSALEIYKIVKTLGIDIVHAQTRVTQIVGFLVSRMSKVKYISTCHGFFNTNLGRRILPAWGDRVIAISEAVSKHLKDDFKVEDNRISLVYNGIDVKRFVRSISDEEKNNLREKFGIKKDVFILGTIARFTPDKGHDIILYALIKILKEIPNVVVVFVGDGKERGKIIDLAQSFYLLDKVVFIKPQIHTIGILSIMDIFMFTPRRKEGLGLSLLEALAMGKPAVATSVGGICNVIENGVNGFLVEPSRPELLVEPVVRLLTDKELYKKMSRAGRETVVQRFSINGMVNKVEAIYDEVIRGF